MNNSTSIRYETKESHVVVLGGGPGGYSAAFRCADLGIKTTIIERYPTLGGVCLNVGCIPSKTLLDIMKTVEHIKVLNNLGIINEKITYNIDQIRKHKRKIIDKLTVSLNNMAKKRDINVINGYGTFIDTNSINIKKNDNSNTKINFKYAIIAAGSHSSELPIIQHKDNRIWSSTDALTLKNIPEQLLIIGAGAIGLEIATIYSTLGSTIDIIELLDQPIPNIDKDITTLFIQYTKTKYNLLLETKIIAIEHKTDGLYVSTENKNLIKNKKRYDTILVATGRLPNGKLLNADKINININQLGYIHVDNQMRTNIPNIFAIGDIVSTPMLAHKSIHEGHIAAEVIAGMKSYFDPKVIPSAVYTDPEIASTGYTEKTAKMYNIEYEATNFPWKASGRAVSSNAEQGMTKLLFDKKTHKIIGGTIIGKNASELIGEVTLAIEMGCDAEDITLTIHAHPTLSETIGLSAAIYDGSITDLPNIKLNIKNKLHQY